MDYNDVAEQQIERQRAQLREAERQAERADQYTQDVERVSVEVTSPRGEVTARTDSAGRLAQLRFGDAAADLSAAALSKVTFATIEDARRRTAAAVLRLTEQAFGPDDPFTVALRRDYLGPDAEPEPGEPGAPRSPFLFGR